MNSIENKIYSASNVGVSQKRLVIIQRVLTNYRLKLFSKLSSEFSEVTIYTSFGLSKGTLKLYDSSIEIPAKVKIRKLRSLKLKVAGPSRQTHIFIYPQILFSLRRGDYFLLEGTTNLINNIFVIPLLKTWRKKIIWWDSGSSSGDRGTRRKLMDFISQRLIGLTDVQIAYSSVGRKYMVSHMGAKNCKVLLNTIQSNYVENNQDLIKDLILKKSFDYNAIKLLYVGVIEPRKKVRELIDLVLKLNTDSSRFELRIVGGGNELKELKETYGQSEFIQFEGPIYDDIKLSKFYLTSDLFVLPGDGGLAIVQSLLFGLPAVCIKADGTEKDYLPDEMILNNFNDLELYLRTMKNPPKIDFEDSIKRFSSNKWVKDFVNIL